MILEMTERTVILTIEGIARGGVHLPYTAFFLSVVFQAVGRQCSGVPVLRASELTLLGPHSRFGDKLLTVRVFCPHIWECGAKRVKRIRI